MITNRARHWIAGLLAVVLCCGANAFAQSTNEIRLNFEPNTTQIEFTLDDVLHTVRGTFRLTSGTIHFDQTTGIADGALVVDTTSGASGNDTRDRKMKKDILEIGKYPDATFVPKKVLGTLAIPGSSQVEVTGTFRIHGADHEITLTVPAKVDGDRLEFHTSFVIPFVKWGMKDPSTFVLRVKKEVQMSLSGTATIAH